MSIVRHNVTANTVGLWQFDGTLLDSSGNGFDMSSITGTLQYCEMWPHTNGIYLNGGSEVGRTAHDVALALAGDMTLEFFLCPVWIYSSLSTDGGIITFSGAASTASTENFQYYFYIQGTSTKNFGFDQRHGAGVDSITVEPGILRLERDTPVHFAITRISNVIRFYVNGNLEFTSSALVTPDGGSNTKLVLGSPYALAPPLVISSLKILNIGYTATQVKTEYNSTFGPVFGII